MLQYMISQLAELDELHRRLGEMRLRYIRAALQGEGDATLSEASQAESQKIYEEIYKKYRGDPWLKLIPPCEEDPNPEIAKVLSANREIGMKTIMMLHKIIMQTPIIS